jgi:hypothetical protein
MDLNKKEKLKLYYKKYYIDNKQKYKDYNEKIKLIKENCDICGCDVVKKHILVHKKNQKTDKKYFVKSRCETRRK